MRSALALSLLLAVASPGRADEVLLRSGTKIEGKAKREGDSVVIRVESGEIRLPAETVERIEKSESSSEVAERRRAALDPRDVRGRLQLAAYCREHGLPATERALLQEVLELEPNHAQARRLLGYERDGSGWVSRSQQQQQARAAEEAAWLERQRALARADAERAQEKAQQEAQRARDEALQARDEAQRARDEAVYSPMYYGGYPWYRAYYYPHPRPHGLSERGSRPERDCNTPPAPAFPISGVRHPRDTSFVGVKGPRESHR